MARFFIKEAWSGESDGSFACGPVGFHSVSEILVRTEDGEEFYMSFAEVDGITNFYKTEKSILKNHLTLEFENKEEEDMFMNGCDHGGEYDEFFENPIPEWDAVYKYLIYLAVDCSPRHFIVGKYLDEMEVPMTSREQAYLDEMEEWDEDEEEEDEE